MHWGPVCLARALHGRMQPAGPHLDRWDSPVPRCPLLQGALGINGGRQQPVHDDVRVAADGGGEVGVVGDRQGIVAPVGLIRGLPRAEVPRYLCREAVLPKLSVLEILNGRLGQSATGHRNRAGQEY